MPEPIESSLATNSSLRGLPSAVFVVGSPRSGTTFFGQALGQLDGFVDAGELLADRLPRLYTLPSQHAAAEICNGMRAAGYPLDGRLRPVIHTPEMAFVAPALLAMDPGTVIVQLIRDGRDVAASLIEQGWFGGRRVLSEEESPGSGGSAESSPGALPRYWTERSRFKEFASVSEARRAAWLWRRAVLAGLGGVRHMARTLTLRYEQACFDHPITSERLAGLIVVPRQDIEMALSSLRSDSVGRWRTSLTHLQLQDVYREAGELLRYLGCADLPPVFDSELAEVESSSELFGI